MRRVGLQEALLSGLMLTRARGLEIVAGDVSTKGHTEEAQQRSCFYQYCTLASAPAAHNCTCLTAPCRAGSRQGDWRSWRATSLRWHQRCSCSACGRSSLHRHVERSAHCVLRCHRCLRHWHLFRSICSVAAHVSLHGLSVQSITAGCASCGPGVRAIASANTQLTVCSLPALRHPLPVLPAPLCLVLAQPGLPMTAMAKCNYHIFKQCCSGN